MSRAATVATPESSQLGTGEWFMNRALSPHST
jgi:hypothetical protein